ncbi:MAG TPA: hypothetical protein VK889_03825 [Solirubrobacterales bacterium]|nr:hypothetical protein [Solirubrobacterales bacterium]
MSAAAPAVEPRGEPALEIAAGAPAVVVTAVGRADGSAAAASALACAGAEPERVALLVGLGGRAPRPTLVASEAARRLEERLATHLPSVRVAARGQLCCLAADADADGIAATAAAVTVARGSLAVIHLPPALLQSLLEAPQAPRLSAALLRADLDRDRALVALLATDLLGRDLRLAVLKRQLGWVAARRAHFGVLAADAPGGLPPAVLRNLGLR